MKMNNKLDDFENSINRSTKDSLISNEIAKLILRNISWFEGYESELPEWVRLFLDTDYDLVDEWMKDLANFYDWHTEDNKLIDQLVGTEKIDSQGYFTKNKMMLILENDWVPLGMFCLNIKRGWSVKIWPVVVSPEARWQGIGKLLFSTIDKIAKDFEIRKLYATTSHLNHNINKIFSKYWYVVEATYPNHYKHWSDEFIRWKNINNTIDNAIDLDDNICLSAHSNLSAQWEITISNSVDEADANYLDSTLQAYRQWHDDLWNDFLHMMIKWYERGKQKLSFQNKSKEILIAKDDIGNYLGTLTLSPKRWWPVKVYPMSWTTEAQKKMIEIALQIAKNNWSHKLYTFAYENDLEQINALESIWFVPRGILISPYKKWFNLVTFDLFII